MSEYNEQYYYSGCGDVPYENADQWMAHFNKIADRIVADLAPRTVLDAGCAMGYLVAALRDRGVEAYGIDISDYAISKVREDVKPYCVVGSLTEPLPDSLPQAYDLVVSIEVLEHLYPQEGARAIENLCALTDTIVFSSTPDDFTEETHVNVQQREYWARLFAQHGFLDDLTYRPTYLTYHAVCYRKTDDWLRQIEKYEHNIRLTDQKGRGAAAAMGEAAPVEATLYLDFGEGFGELNAQKVTWGAGRFSQKFDWGGAPVRALRFDPMEGRSCVVVFLQVLSNAGELAVSQSNGYRMGQADVFSTTDPQYLIDVSEKNVTWVELRAQIIPIQETCFQLAMDELAREHRDMNGELQEKTAELAREKETAAQSSHEAAQVREQLARTEGELAASQRLYQVAETRRETLEETVARMSDETARAQTERAQTEEKLDWARERLSRTEKELSQAEEELSRAEERQAQLEEKLARTEEELALNRQHYHAAIEQRDALKGELAQANAAYQSISNAFFWKITKPFRVVLDQVKGLFKGKGYVYLARKGIACWRQNGLAYTLRRTKEKLRERRGKAAPPSEVKRLGYISGFDMERMLSEQVDIVVPIYNGYEHLEPLLGSLEQTKMPYRLILIDDHSTDERIQSFLKEYARGKKNVLLLKNDKNLGFTRSVNRGLQCAKGHVALVNTDVRVPPMWLERLMLPIVAGENVASATPFTNSGTICSFPNFCQDNPLFLGMEPAEIDKAFQTIQPPYHIIPTGVGFCMGLNRKAVQAVGLLDADSFGRGYGEENDWCRRAAEAGFVNVQVENLFVYHKHGGSFPSEEKQRLCQEHYRILLKKHPDYDRLVAEYCAQDPCAGIREDVKERLLRGGEDLDTVLVFNHSWGGGATDYLVRERKRLLREDKRVICVEYRPEEGAFQVTSSYREASGTTTIPGDFAGLCDALDGRVDEIWGNELVSYPDLYDVLAELPRLARRKGAKLRYFLHDYFALCPTVNLLTPEDRYCALPALAECEECLRKNPRYQELHCSERRSGMAVWRSNWQIFLGQCDEVRTFSEASKRLLRQAYPELPESKITVRPHSIDYLPRLDGKEKWTETFNVGVVGAIHKQKGLSVLEDMARLAQERDLPVKFVVLGTTHPPISKKLCVETGAYQRNALPRLVLENDIDLALIPSIWPETFSYTTQEMMDMGLPIACFDLGAPAERVKRYDKGMVLPRIDAPSALERLLDYAERNGLLRCGGKKRVLFVAARYDYAVRYRVEHFQEELLYRGVGSELSLMERIRYVDIGSFDAIVVYRCGDEDGIRYLKTVADRQKIKMFFDIDDLVYHKEAVNASGLPPAEKQQYLKLAQQYSQAMELSDGIITSTQALAEYLKESFPEKPVCVRRNSASLEMEMLSVCADSGVAWQEDGPVYLAYFSGSWTHDNDFALIAEPLARIFDRYENVILRIYGCLHIPERLKGYQGRIEMYDFTEDWRSLPEKIAQAHIHLAPLEDTQFNRCKSENKWTEAALAARPIVASYNSELALVIESGVTGFLCGSPEEWEDALARLVEDPALRRKIGRQAQEAVLSTHLTRNNGEEAARFILDGVAGSPREAEKPHDGQRGGEGLK